MKRGDSVENSRAPIPFTGIWLTDPKHFSIAFMFFIVFVNVPRSMRDTGIHAEDCKRLVGFPWKEEQ